MYQYDGGRDRTNVHTFLLDCSFALLERDESALWGLIVCCYHLETVRSDDTYSSIIIIDDDFDTEQHTKENS